jgi:hypothetical protein
MRNHAETHRRHRTVRAMHYKSYKRGQHVHHLMAWCNLEEVVKTFRVLGLSGCLAEVNAVHPEYKQGDLVWNRDHHTFPVIRYVTSEEAFVRFAHQYAGTHLCLVGINPRPQAFLNERGYPRSAREAEIRSTQNLLLDFDLDDPTSARLQAFAAFLDKTTAYCLGRGFLPPARAFTGRGYHLLFQYPRVDDCPDMRERISVFSTEFRHEYHAELGRLGATLDNTFDLCRKTRIYGTPKPDIGIISTLYQDERREDDKIREYLLGLQLPEREGSLTLRVSDELPAWFWQLLDNDPRVRGLWDGTGKHTGDCTRSGYDFSLSRHLLRLGHRDLDELATILTLRPNGAVKKSSTRAAYVKHTLAKALLT